MRQLNVGEKVRIRKQLIEPLGRTDGCFGMNQYVGREATIVAVSYSRPNRYYIDIDRQQYAWVSEWLEPLKKSSKAKIREQIRLLEETKAKLIADIDKEINALKGRPKV